MRAVEIEVVGGASHPERDSELGFAPAASHALREALGAAEVVPRVSAICEGLFWLLVGVQVLTFLLGISGVRRLARVGWMTSGGAVARELRALTSST